MHKSLAYVKMSWILVAHFTLQQLTIVSSTEIKKYIHESYDKAGGIELRFCGCSHFLDRLLSKSFNFPLSSWHTLSKIAFSNLFLNAVWCSSSFSSENMHLNDLSHVCVFFLFLALFSFDQNFDQILFSPKAPWAKVNYHKISDSFGNLHFLQFHDKTLLVSILVVKKLFVVYGRYRKITVQEELSGHWLLIKLIDSTCVFIF